MGQKRSKRMRNKDMKSGVIVVEGGEGSGTTSIVEHLAKRFGSRVIRTREPGGSPRAEEIREVILSDKMKSASPEEMFELFWEARDDHVEQTIKPALKRRQYVITDRFDSSTWAYQIFAQGGENLKDIFWEKRKTCLKGIEPELYILLDVDPEVGIARAKDRGGDLTHFDKRKLDFHHRVREGLLDFMSFVPHIIVNAGQSKKDVEKQVLDIVTGLIDNH